MNTLLENKMMSVVAVFPQNGGKKTATVFLWVSYGFIQPPFSYLIKELRQPYKDRLNTSKHKLDKVMKIKVHVFSDQPSRVQCFIQ